MYGSDDHTIWYDYDIVSAYTTVMAMMCHPSYNEHKNLSLQELNLMTNTDILYSFIIIQCDFKFPEKVKYPSIACFIDETSTVYPLSGSAFLTGSEYLLAKSQGCEFQIKSIDYIPFRPGVYPFKRTIKDLQNLRSQHAKGSILNALYKDLGNSLYGLTARGISSKKRFDLKAGKTVKLEVNDLANPIICSWITSFIRSLVGELLHFLSEKGGRVVSVTTDGFITDIPDLENILNTFTGYSLYNEYCKTRFELSNSSTGLELKKSGEGIVS